MPNRKSEKTKGVIRHLLTLIGGILVTLGWLSAEDSDIIITTLMEVIGGILILWSTVSSVLNKNKIPDDGQA